MGEEKSSSETRKEAKSKVGSKVLQERLEKNQGKVQTKQGCIYFSIAPSC